MASAKVDFGKKTGAIKPMNGVNSGPKTKVFTYDATDLFKEANIAISRLHDVEYPYGSGEFVDIHCVFPNFDADVDDPASYNFELTDCYIKAILDSGSKVMYRLGESIEHAPVVRHINPPKDFLKWAKIGEHIIRHYNEGWANGFHWDIQYWEIWNEADGDEFSTKKHVWGGTKEEFFDFFEVSCRYLKETFPNLKIGGPALAGNWKWGVDLIREMGRRNCPMDFFSWHMYQWTVEAYLERTKLFKDTLLESGYPDAELILDEWNYVESWNHQARSFRKLIGPTGAAFCAALMVALQHSANDMAVYFEADVIKEWCGIFQVKDMCIGQFAKGKDMGLLEPRKPYYAFKGFGLLQKLGEEVESSCEGNGVYVCAAKDEEEGAVMLVTYHSNIVDGCHEVTLTGLPAEGCTVEVYMTDEGYDEKLEMTMECAEETLVLPLHMVDEQIRVIRVKT